MTSLYQGHPDTQHQHSHTGVTSSNADGWILYYSPEGYPYYYNEITGESQWAEHEQEISEVEDNYDVKYDTLNEEYAVQRSEASDHSSDQDDVSDEETQSSGTEDQSTSVTEEESDGFNKDFEAYLLTPEGQRELEEERQALERYSEQVEPEDRLRRGLSAEQQHGMENDEADDMVLNAFGKSAFTPQDDIYNSRYNPYQQQSYQEQFMQQKRQQEYEYEQYEYEHQQRLHENENFARTYGLPPPAQHNSRYPSRHGVTFEDNFNPGRRSYYDDEDDQHRSSRASRGKQKKFSKSKSRRRERRMDDDLEGGGAMRDSAGQGSEDESDDNRGTDVSVSSDDSDVKIIREPLIPKWLSWNNLTRFVDRTVRDPVVNVSSKVYSSLVPGPTPAPKKNKRATYDYDEEGGSGSGSSCASGSDSEPDDDEADHADIALDIQPLSLNKKPKRNKDKSKASSVGYTLPTTTALFSNISHFLSLSTVTTLFTTQQKEWLQQTYDATSASIWNYVTNTAEILVDGQPQRRSVHEGGDEPQPLPP